MGSIGKFQMANIYTAAVLLLSGVVPTGLIIRNITGGMYGEFFREFSPAFYHLFTTLISFAIAGLVVYFVIRKMSVSTRLQSHYASTGMLAIGNAIILLYLVIRIYSSTIPGGGPPMVVSMIGAIPVAVAKVLLVIAFIRVLIGIEPKPPKSSEARFA